MRNLIKIYGDCDSFSLSLYANCYSKYDLLSHRKANVENLLGHYKDSLRREFLSNKDKYNLGEFNDFIIFLKSNADRYKFDIKNLNTEQLVDYLKSKLDKEKFFNQMICILDRIKQLEEIKLEVDKNLEYEILDEKLYNKLKKFLIEKKMEYGGNHCTKGPDFLTYFFKLNDETKSWLLQFGDEFKFNPNELADLAFYKNKKIKFSSCTHECTGENIE